MLASIITLLLSLIPFLYNYFTKPEVANRTEIINLEILDRRLDRIENVLNKIGNTNVKPDTAAATTAATP